jgi:phosphohistidine phosphatase
MTQQLYLLRHAMAESWSPLANDFSRPLVSQGANQAQQVSEWMVNSLPPPDTILCSPAKRTRETLAPLLRQWPKLLATTDYVESLYGASLSMLLTLAEDAFSYSDRLMMVGHNPGLQSMLINFLPHDKYRNDQKMSPGTLAVIEFPGGFKRGDRYGNLLHLVQE